MIKRAPTGIFGLKHLINTEKLHILTGIAALFVLLQDNGLYQSLCKLLGVNHQANYAARCLENRAVYDKHL